MITLAWKNHRPEWHELGGRRKDLLRRAETALTTVEALDDEWQATYKELDAASAQLPARPFHLYYQRALQPATEPFIGLDGPNTEHYGEIKQEYVERLRARYQTPSVDACSSVFEDVASFFRNTSARVLTLRYFSNSDVLLSKFESAIKPPWAHRIQVDHVRNFRYPIWLGHPVLAYPPHQEIDAIRKANEDTLRLLKHKLQEIVATLETAIIELPFADKLEKPKPVPKTLIDFSTHIGEHATVPDSAIGSRSTKTRK